MKQTTHKRRTIRTFRRTAVLLGTCAIGVLALAGPAFAHITITPGSAPQGSAEELTFRVPDEDAHAATTQVQVKIPTDPPIAQVLVRPVPGWTSQVQTVKLARPVTTDDGTFSVAVSQVTWSGGRILPGQYQDFAISADPLPSGVTAMVFKTLQAYSNGNVVRWIDTSVPGQPEPDHPAPVLILAPAGSAQATAEQPGSAGSAVSAGSVSSAGSAAGGGSGEGGGGLAVGLGIAGLATGALSLLGLSAGLFLRRRARHS